MPRVVVSFEVSREDLDFLAQRGQRAADVALRLLEGYVRNLRFQDATAMGGRPRPDLRSLVEGIEDPA